MRESHGANVPQRTRRSGAIVESGPRGQVAVGGLGAIYVTDGQNGRVSKFGIDATPARTRSWGQRKLLYR